MVQHRKGPSGSRRPKRRDSGIFRMQDRDWDWMGLVGEQTFVRFDTLGEYGDPDHEPALLAGGDPPDQPERGGRRTGLPWPKQYRKRLTAVLRIVSRWEQHGFADIQQFWAGQPPWIRLTQAGLDERCLPYQEIGWPEGEDKRRLRHDDHSSISHTHRINQIRIRLLAGRANAPRHRWISERELEYTLPAREPGRRRPHKADGVLVLQEDGKWDIKMNGVIVDEAHMKRDQTVGIEVEISRKNFSRLDEYILPSLLDQYHFIWYFCDPAARQAVYTARTSSVPSEADKRRIRIMNLSEYL